MSMEMKDSGIDWIGEIPKHWEILPHKRVMYKIKDIQEQYNGEPILSLTMKGVIVRDLEAGGKMPTSFDGYQRIYPGNLLQCLFDIDVTPRCVGLIKHEGLTSPAYSHFELDSKACGAYYDYLLRYMDDEKCILHLSKNLRSSLTESDFGLIPTILPPKEEQSRIANFLDKKCAEIDELIALQEQMIAQLNTYKQAVITETVTKGLNPNVKMKDSGVEWIGEIPEHWNLVPLKYLGRTQNGISKGGDYFGEGYPFVNYGDIYKNYFIGSNDASGLAKSTQDDQTNYSVVKGDVFFTRTSETIEEIGFSCACIETINNATFSGFLIRFRPHANILHPIYSGFYFRSTMHRQYFVKEMNIVTRTSLGQELLKGLPVLLPPLAEQQSIANYLDQKCKEIDELISIKKEKIEHLKAYKKSVIYEYVTGKKHIDR